MLADVGADLGALVAAEEIVELPTTRVLGNYCQVAG
jgi:hypothetical protein